MLDFFSKLRSKKPQETAQVLEAGARLGEALENLSADPKFHIYVDEVLNPFYEEAFAAFKKLDPSDFTAVTQAQKVGWVIDEIKRRMDAKVAFGRVARAQLLQQNEEETQ